MGAGGCFGDSLHVLTKVEVLHGIDDLSYSVLEVFVGYFPVFVTVKLSEQLLELLL